MNLIDFLILIVMNNGWISLHRKMLEWEWYDDINTFRLFIHLLLKSNHSQKKYKGIVIETGEVMTGIKLLSEQTGLSMQQVRTSIKHLISTNEITNKTSPQGSIIQIVKYIDYQTPTNKLTNEQQTTNKQLTTNNNNNNNNNKNKEKKDSVFNFRKELINYGFNEELVIDWLKVRKTKKASNTQTAFKGFLNQVEKSNFDKNFILKKCVENSWSGFKSDWIHQEKKFTTKPTL
jgi:hypothetical protein